MTAYPYHLRVARFHEAPLLEQIGADALGMFGPHKMKLSLIRGDFTRALTPGAAHIVVAVNDQDDPVAYCRMRRYGNHLRLHDLFTAPAHNHRGIGRLLLADAFAKAHVEAVGSVVLLTSRNAAWTVPFYEKLGFALTAPEKLPPIAQHHLKQGTYNTEIASVPGYLPLAAMVKEGPF